MGQFVYLDLTIIVNLSSFKLLRVQRPVSEAPIDVRKKLVGLWQFLDMVFLTYSVVPAWPHGQATSIQIIKKKHCTTVIGLVLMMYIYT